jgi:hypothetical protein
LPVAASKAQPSGVRVVVGFGVRVSVGIGGVCVGVGVPVGCGVGWFSFSAGAHRNFGGLMKTSRRPN